MFVENLISLFYLSVGPLGGIQRSHFIPLLSCQFFSHIYSDIFILFLLFESRQLSVNEAGLLAPVLLVISMLMATPIFFHTRVHDPKFGPPWSHVVYCVEDWSSSEEQSGEPEQRIYYSIFSMSMQYVIPFVSMALIYLKIFYYLKGSVLFAYPNLKLWTLSNSPLHSSDSHFLKVTFDNFASQVFQNKDYLKVRAKILHFHSFATFGAKIQIEKLAMEMSRIILMQGSKSVSMEANLTEPYYQRPPNGQS